MSTTEDSPSSATHPASRLPSPARDRTPDVVVEGFDGQLREIRGHNVRLRCCTRGEAQFGVASGVLIAVLITCFVLLIHLNLLMPGESGCTPGADWLKATIGLIIGVFLPRPEIAKTNE